MKGFDLMRTMRLAVATALGALLLAGCTEKPRVLRLCIWLDDFSPRVIEAFERKYGCVVRLETFDSNEAMVERLRTEGPDCCDLIEPSSYIVGQLAQEGLIVPIDHTKCPSVKRNFCWDYVKTIPEDSELKYAVPYNISASGLLYATNRIPKGVGVDSWAVLGNPMFRGRIALLDDMREVIGAGLMSLGHSVNSESAAEIDAAVDQVLKWIPNVDHWDSEDSQCAVADGRVWAALVYSGLAIPFVRGKESLSAHPDLAFAYPREGFVLSCEEFAVTVGCKEPGLAHAFLEFLYADPEIGCDYMNFRCTLLPSMPAIGILDPEFRKLVEPLPEILARGQVLKGFGEKPDTQALYERAWERIVRER